MLSFVAAKQKQGQKEEKVTAETFLWLYVATPEISANSPLSLPVVQESTIKFFFYNRPIRLRALKQWAGTAERLTTAIKLASSTFLHQRKGNFTKTDLDFTFFFSLNQKVWN